MLQHKTKATLLSYPVWALISAIGATNSHRILGPNHLSLVKSQARPFIFSFWHSRILIPLYQYQWLKIGSIISSSKDGEYISQVAHRFGYEVSRGSASRRAAAGLVGLLHMLGNGQTIIITPDGPRGPREVAQMGVVQLAKSSGVPVTPLGLSASRHIRFKSWDRFILPLPLGRMVTVVGEDIHVPADASDEAMEGYRQAVTQEMRRVTRLADEYTRTAVLPHDDEAT